MIAYQLFFKKIMVKQELGSGSNKWNQYKYTAMQKYERCVLRDKLNDHNYM